MSDFERAGDIGRRDTLLSSVVPKRNGHTPSQDATALPSKVGKESDPTSALDEDQAPELLEELVNPSDALSSLDRLQQAYAMLQEDYDPRRDRYRTGEVLRIIKDAIRGVETGKTSNKQRPRRNFAKERSSALAKRAHRLGDLKESRNQGELGDQVIKLAQALILCSLPFKPTKERQIIRGSRLSDGSTLSVVFSATTPNVDLPFGSDRNLISWLFDRAIQSGSPFISFSSAREYLIDTGRTDSGKNIRDLADRLRRIAGLVVNIQRQGHGSEQTRAIPVISASNLPISIAANMIDGPGLFGTEDSDGLELVETIPGFEDRGHGVKLQEELFEDISKHFVALPRQFWKRMQEAGGSPQQQAIFEFLLYRCYCARRESVVPWSAIREQFGGEDSNPWRLKQTTSKVIDQLRILWPEARLEAIEAGVLVSQPVSDLLPTDPDMHRVRRLERGG